MDKTRYHELLCCEMHETYKRKNHDYGDSFSKSFDKYGIISAMVRMSDKWNRLEELAVKNEEAKVDESLRDTLMDLANYALLTVIELDAKDIAKFEEDKRVKITKKEPQITKKDPQTFEFTLTNDGKTDVWSMILGETEAC